VRFPTCTLLVALVLAGSNATPIAPGSPAAPQDAPAFTPVVMDDAYQLVFFAVLEGLYRDGVSSEVVAALTAAPPEGGYPAHFVWQCPLCMPALNAFNVYAARPPFCGIKGRLDTFGAGLAPELAERCLGPDLNELVQRWIGERLDALRLTEEERDLWHERFEHLRKQGMESLWGMQQGGAYAGVKRCAVCDGANDALQRP
jgi:hypothetical protein